jgi:hypothetical protein
MIEYKVRKFNDELLVVSRYETQEKDIEGLTKTRSQCIIMDNNEFELFVEKLNLCLQVMKSTDSVN